MFRKILIPALSLGLLLSPVIANTASAQAVQQKEDSVITQASLSYNIISGVPDVNWYKGCTSTAFSMIVRYWDTHGLPYLIQGSVSDSQLIDRIADNYLHPDPNQQYGVSFGVQPMRMQAFFNDTIYGYSTRINDVQSGDAGSWNRIVQEIDAGRPMIMNLSRYVHPGVGVGGHTVTIVGYDNYNKQLIIHNTYQEGDVRWNWDYSYITSLIAINPRSQ